VGLDTEAAVDEAAARHTARGQGAARRGIEKPADGPAADEVCETDGDEAGAEGNRRESFRLAHLARAEFTVVAAPPGVIPLVPVVRLDHGSRYLAAEGGWYGKTAQDTSRADADWVRPAVASPAAPRRLGSQNGVAPLLP